MIKKFIKRLRSISGESLVESMASVLIFTLASIALLTMINASANINTEAKEADAIHQEQMSIAEKADDKNLVAGDHTVEFSFESSSSKLNGITISNPVDVYQKPGDSNALFSYFLHGTAR